MTPFEFQQHAHRHEGSPGQGGDGGGPLPGGLRVVGVVDEEPGQDVRVLRGLS
jgi:hypothetical protein